MAGLLGGWQGKYRIQKRGKIRQNSHLKCNIHESKHGDKFPTSQFSTFL